ncbi:MULTISPECIES: VOC family protein [Pseudomonas]|uniref:Glyoxalase/fosfomycin resistance/dioxygenase domain-containing protein n=2 Tax=Pseudomonas TaxID=286 RepID=A0A9X8MG08_9PSED|nr:hypothetical protein SAMN05216409_113131 [Pseudomonas lutea]
MYPKLNRIMLYVRDVQVTCTFYERYFGFASKIDVDDLIAELIPKIKMAVPLLWFILPGRA